ncbi:MAG TPA: hypothetical protein VLJ59_07295 [Mycobacteriales bacterium]|nr:hypothetical protein [Mycobacteriales bacterium]
MVVAATSPDQARAVVRGLPHQDEIRVVPATRSLRELGRVRDRVQALVGAAGHADVDTQRNRVTVWTSRPAAVRGLLAARGVDAEAYAVSPVPRGLPTACRRIAPIATATCDPPFRGGLSIVMENVNGVLGTFCTSAFNLIDNSGRFYTTTAGHCFARPVPAIRFSTAATLPNGAARRLGDGQHRRALIVDEPAPLLDFAITPVVDPDFWVPGGVPRPFVFFECGTPTAAQCFASLNKHRYRIWDVRNYADMTIGNLVCMTGASPLTGAVRGTRCGEITGLGNGAIQANICAKSGDSGAPLFNQVTHTAFGIESQVVPPNTADGQCRPNPAEWASLSTPISVVLAVAQQRTGRTFTVIVDN